LRFEKRNEQITNARERGTLRYGKNGVDLDLGIGFKIE